MAKRKVKVPKPKLQWYALRAREGKAKGLKRELRRLIQERDLKMYVGKILIPRKRQIVLKKGEKRGERRVEEKQMRFGRGYVFVQAALVKAEVWKLLNGATYSGGLIPTRYNPTPIPDEHIQGLITEERADNKAIVKTGLKPGDEVEILEGMFKDMKARVQKVFGERTIDPRIAVQITILGRPVEHTFKHFQIQKPKKGAFRDNHNRRNTD